MHMLIRVLVPAANAIEAVGTTRFALDRLIGIGEGASTAFDYYKTLDESTARYRDHPRYGGLDPAHQLSSATGKQLLDDAIEAQATWFVETVATLREKLDRLEPADMMDDVDLARYDCYRLGQFAGPSVWIYDEHGAGLRSRSAVDRYVEDLTPIRSGWCPLMSTTDRRVASLGSASRPHPFEVGVRLGTREYSWRVS